MNIVERVASMRAGVAASAEPKAAPVEKKVHVEQAKPEAVVEKAPSTEVVFDIANNAVAKIMERSDLSDKGKLESVVEFLAAKDQDYSAAQKNFAEFEAYFTYEQSRRTQVSEQHIQRLMDELEDSTKSTIEAILHDFNVVSAGAGNIKQLLRVMEKARVDDTTVETLTEAYRLNETLLEEISALKDALAAQKKEEASSIQTHDRLRDRKKERETGITGRLLGFIGANQGLEESVYYASYHLKNIQVKVQQFEQNVTAKEMQRNKKLEDGELTILRSVDATEGGFTNQILETAKDSLALIKGTRVSIERLLVANAKSRAAAAEITDAISATAGRETILKGALQVVARETHAQGENLGTEVEKLTREKQDAGDDEVQVTLVTVKLDKVNQTDQSALDYERVLETRVVSFEMLASANVQSDARAQQFTTLVESHGELLSNLQQQALPVTANALEMGLQQGVALRDGLLAAGVRDATKKAQSIFASNLEGATEAKNRLETENLAQMHAAIAALGEAQALIISRTDKAIEHGLASIGLVEKVTAAAEGVRGAMSDFQRVGAVLASHDAPPATPQAPPAPPPVETPAAAE